MKLPVLAIAIIFFASCNNNNTSLVKSADSKTKKSKSKEPFIPVPKFGIEGFYTGDFAVTESNPDKTSFDNKITICIDSLNGSEIFGHSVVAGNDRPFRGIYKKEAGTFDISVKEPGDDKYDGEFNFTVYPDEKKIKGVWTANDKTIAATERNYELQQKPFKYDASLALTDEIVGEILYGSYDEKKDQGEAITEDAIKKNASQVLLQSKDVENMYKADLEVMRNAIYARHGYSFKNPRMRFLFDHYVYWYMPVSTNVTAQLTSIELKNIELIKRYEKHASKYYDSYGR
jgi:hypothetical protein